MRIYIYKYFVVAHQNPETTRMLQYVLLDGSMQVNNTNTMLIIMQVNDTGTELASIHFYQIQFISKLGFFLPRINYNINVLTLRIIKHTDKKEHFIIQCIDKKG